MKNDKNYKYTRLINQFNADDGKNEDGGSYDSADQRYSKFKCSPNESTTTCNNDNEGSAVSDEKEELSEESSFLDSNGILKRYYNNTQYKKKILIGIRAKDFRKYLHLYKSLNTSTNNSKYRSSIKYSRSWTPILILILFGFLIVIIAILEIFIIHYAHRFGAGYGSSGKTFFSKSVPWGRPSSQIGQTDIDYRYYYADNNDDVVVANSQNQNGANKFHGRPPPGSAGDRVRSKNVYNYINYNFEQPSPLSNDMIFNSNTNNKISSKQIPPHNVFAKQKIPIFVGIERYSKSNEELKEKSPSMHSSHQSQQHQFKDLRNNDDMMFEKAKSLLLSNNKIPKVMPAKSKILSMESVEKSNSNNNNSNKLGIYLGGEGRLRQQIYKSYKTNGMVKERIVFYSPFQTFDILSLLPRGLKPSIYYNYLLMKQKRNEKRFKEIMEIETEKLEKFCRNQEQDNLHCGHSYSVSETSFRPYHSLNNNTLALTTNLKMCPQIPKSFESIRPPQSIVGEANERSFKDLEKKIHENNIATAASGGSSRPNHCIARHKLAVIIPFRDREEHLFLLLNQLHPFLQKQELFYRVYVVEQYGSNLFNKAMLMNAGFKEAFMDSNFHCYVFHDVDLIPEISLNMYSCPKQPRHLSVAIDEMDYKLKYQMLVGGVLMFKPEHFVKVNGYSGLYWGWGAEDDDMAFRIQHVNLHITRPLESLGRYHMIKHVKRKPIALHKRYKLLSLGTQRIQIDGLNSISYNVINRTEKALYTHLLIDIGKPPQGYK